MLLSEWWWWWPMSLLCLVRIERQKKEESRFVWCWKGQEWLKTAAFVYTLLLRLLLHPILLLLLHNHHHHLYHHLQNTILFTFKTWIQKTKTKSSSSGGYRRQSCCDRTEEKLWAASRRASIDDDRSERTITKSAPRSIIRRTASFVRSTN